MRRPPSLVALAALVLASGVLPSGVGVGSRARALDVEVDSELAFQAYEVRAPGAVAFIARRRFVGDLGLALVEPLSSPDALGRVVRFVATGRLRLDQDFTDDCLVGRDLCLRATDAEARSDYQPLARSTRVDVPALEVAVTGLPLGAEARLGRQLRVDAIGLARFDGLALALRPIAALGARAYGGALVRGTSLGGSPQFDAVGDRYVPSEGGASWLDPPRDAWIVGGDLDASLGAALSANLAARYAWDERGALLRRLSLSLASSPHELVRLDARGVLDLLDLTPISAMAALEVRAAPARLRAAIERRVPRFDPSTIWAYFEASPVDELALGARGRVSDDLELAGTLRGRRVERGQGEDLDAGIELGAWATVAGLRLGASGFAWSGSLGPTAGVALEASRELAQRVSADLTVSVWHFDDPLRVDVYGTVVSTILGARWQMTDESVLALELQHAYSGYAGHRLRGLLTLRVLAWR